MNVNVLLASSDVRGGAHPQNPTVELIAKTAIVVYEGTTMTHPAASLTNKNAQHGNSNILGDCYQRSNASHVVIAAVHDIQRVQNGFGEDKTKEGPPTLGTGRPLEAATLDLILRTISGQETAEARRREMIPEELLYLDSERMVWYRPERRHPIWFKTGRTDFDKAIFGQEVLWPALLFMAELGRGISAWALKNGTRRPLPDTPLYYAPLYNFFATGSMCLGNITVPRTIGAAYRDGWERAIYETEFTHSNYGSTKYLNHPGGQDGLWQEMRDRSLDEGFPAHYLVAAKNAAEKTLTVGEAISK